MFPWHGHHNGHLFHPLISYEEAKTKIKILPSLAHWPTATNTGALTVAQHDKLAHQSFDSRYVSMVEQPKVYMLMDVPSWEDFPDPGPLWQYINSGSRSATQWDAEVIHAVNKNTRGSQSNIIWSIIDALNEAVSHKYEWAGGDHIRVQVCKANDCPHTILSTLLQLYDSFMLLEKTQNGQQFNAPWNPSKLVEQLFKHLEECYVATLMAKPAYMVDQMIGNAIIAIQCIG